MIRDFPATLEIDGHTINSEPILVSYIKQMLSILLVVPVIFLFRLLCMSSLKNSILGLSRSRSLAPGKSVD